MKKFKVLLFTIYAVLVAGLMSCGSDGPGSMNAEEAQAAFSSVNDNLAASLGDMSETAGFDGLNSFADITGSSNPFGKVSYKRKEIREQLKMSLTSLRSMLTHPSTNARFPGGDDFDFDENIGVYTYNFETEMFDYSESGTIIKILYPTEGSSSNNADFRLAGYEEELTGDEYSPTFIDASIFVDGTLEAEISLEAEYREDGEPKFIDMSLFLKPFSFKVKLDDRSNTSTSVSESLSKDGSILIGVGVSVTYNSSDKSEDNIKKLSGHVQLMRIKFVASLVVAELEGPEDFRVAIKIDGKDAGNIVLDEDTEEPVIRYNNGETDNLEDVFADLAEELGSLTGEEGPM